MMKLSFLPLLFAVFFLSGCGDEASQLKGQEYGQKHTMSECNNRAMEMIIECRVTECSIVPSDFAKGCAMTAKFDKKYCEEVPTDSAMKSVKWVEEQCTSHDDSESCTKVLKYVASRCLGGA
ncbi:MAG: hypothetical protein JKY11_07600 [Alphaproteobacteria bacterium]|nr:hypothetical protein [Alphaproteobacteria bacterium]